MFQKFLFAIIESIISKQLKSFLIKAENGKNLLLASTVWLLIAAIVARTVKKTNMFDQLPIIFASRYQRRCRMRRADTGWFVAATTSQFRNESSVLARRFSFEILARPRQLRGSFPPPFRHR